MVGRKSMKKIIILLLIAGAAWKFYNYTGSVSLGPGIMAGEVPQQERLSSPISHILDDYIINEISTFNIKAKVLAKKNYHTGRESDLSPTDLALGWGNMSDESILEQIEISQSGRFYYWNVESFPIPRKEIETHSANMHLIPADKSVEREIGKIRNGDIIEISGSLVNVTAQDDNWRWKSSQTRNDTGMGACELILVKSLYIVTR